MIRVTALYPQASDTHFNMDYYLHKHIPLVKARAKEIGVSIGVEVDKGLGSLTPGDPAPYQIVGFMIFDKLEDFQNLVTHHGQELIGDVSNFTNVPWQMQISDTIVTAAQ
jgi:uncharacterized protein (TIGR02118 family)